MRYWAYFAAKLIVAGGILYASLGLLNPLAPPDPGATVGAAPSTNPSKSSNLAANPTSGQARSFSVAEPRAEIQVDEQPEKNKTDGAVVKPLDKEERTPELAPLSDGGRYLAINLALMVWFLFGAGMLYLIVYDQRYRCRVCLRRLRMPVETGSRGFMLQMGRPRTEYICPYGHGTLKQEEFQTSGLENPEWTAHSGDMWDELYAASKRDHEEE
jgi:hypothetical protein